jgi:hypothetical protein
MKTVLPYPVLTGDVITDVLRIELDGVGLSGHLDADRRTIDLNSADHQNWRVLTVHVQVKGPIGDLTAANSPWTDVQATATVESRSTDFRATELLRVDAGHLQRWTASIDINRSEVFGSVIVTGVITATVDGIASRRIGTGENWRISLDDVATPPPGDALTMAWEDFKEPSDPVALAVLKQNSGLPTLLDIGTSPTLYLNRGFTGLEGLLSTARRSKAEQALCDTVRTFIAAQTWSTLFVEAIQHVTLDDSGDVEWPTETWRQSVLRTVIAHIHGVADDNSLRATYNEFTNPDAVGVVLQQVHIACSEMGKTPRLLAGAIMDISTEAVS